jgi:hypothetical protein
MFGGYNEEIYWAPDMVSSDTDELRSFVEEADYYGPNYNAHFNLSPNRIQTMALTSHYKVPVHPLDIQYPDQEWTDDELSRMSYLNDFYSEIEVPYPSQNLQEPLTIKLKMSYSRLKLAMGTSKIIDKLYPEQVRRRHHDKLFGRLVPEDVQQQAETLLEVVDSTEGHIEDGETFTLSSRSRFLSVLVAEAKNELTGALNNKPGTREVVHNYVHSAMKRRNMRPKHIASMLPIIVELVITPTRAEVQARQIRSALAIINREEEYSTQHYSRESPWLFNWFGSRRKGRNQVTN